MQTSLDQVTNPTDAKRHEMLKEALQNAGRPEDYDYIVNSLSPPPDITNFGSPGDLMGLKIGVIGGGLAGMSAAYELRKLGADITILEASDDRIGGRVYTFYFDEAGSVGNQDFTHSEFMQPHKFAGLRQTGDYYGELGAMRIPLSHETTWHYINLFGLDTISLTPPRRNNFLYVHNTRLRTSDSVQEILYPKYELTPQEINTPWNRLIDYAMTYKIKQLPPNVRAEMINILPDYSPSYQALTNISLRQNYEELGLSQGAINLISGVTPLNGALLNIAFDELASDEYTLDFINNFRIEGGNVNLPLAFYESFYSKNPLLYPGIPAEMIGSVVFKAGHRVTGIYKSSYRNKIILKYENASEGKDAADVFDYVICTIPFSSLRNVEIKPFFGNMKMQAILELNYINAHKTLFLCNKRFWEKNASYGNINGGISFTDLIIQSIIYPGDHISCREEAACSPDEPGVLVASYNLNQNSTRLGGLPDRLRYELIRQQVEEVHGLVRGYLNSIVELYKSVTWNNEPDYQGAFSLYLPGHKKLFSYELTQPEYNNTVFFAGEHISAKHGWMQGALYTGKAAANNLAYHIRNQVKEQHII